MAQQGLMSSHTWETMHPLLYFCSGLQLSAALGSGLRLSAALGSSWQRAAALGSSALIFSANHTLKNQNWVKRSRSQI